jgi:hypothetical protein
MQYDVCPLDMRSRCTSELDVLPSVISCGACLCSHAQNLAVACMYSSVQDFMLIVLSTATCVLCKARLCCHIYVCCVTENEIVSQAQNMVMLVLRICDKKCTAAMNLLIQSLVLVFILKHTKASDQLQLLLKLFCNEYS